jgi:tRNA(Ser,Leu) C12 N-acetylase TAN1
MNKELLELFRPEIEMEAGRRIKKAVNMLYNLNIPISKIAQTTEMPEEKVIAIIHDK